MSTSVEASSGKGMMSSTLLVAVVTFMIVFSFVFILLYTFKPSIVREMDNGVPVSPPRADAGKCVIGATLVALVVLLAGWASKSCAGSAASAPAAH